MQEEYKIKVWVVDDQRMFALGIARLFEDTNDIVSTNVLYNGRDVLDQLNKDNIPDIFLIAVEISGISGCELVKQLIKKFSQSKIIAISAYSDLLFVEQMFKCGSLGFIQKSENPESLLLAIRKVYEGGNAFFNDVSLNFLLMKYKNNENITNSIQLSDLELQIMRLIKQENSNKQIADILHYSVSSIENFKRQIMRKIGAKTTVGIVNYFFERKLK